MTINLILDKTKLVESSNAIIVYSEKDYFISYGGIKKAITKNQDIKVISYSSPVSGWLSKAFVEYPGVNIIHQEISFKELLAKKWKIIYDIEISDAVILNERLLEIQIEGEKENVSFSDFVCDNFISPHLNSRPIAKSKYGELINDLVQYFRQNQDLPKIFQTILDIKIRELVRSDPNNIIFNLIAEDIGNAYDTVSTFRIINSYPEKIQTNILSKATLTNFRDIKPNLTELNIENYIKQSKKYIESVVPELKIFFNNTIIANEITLRDTLNSLSGLLKIEIEFILEKLKENPGLISDNIISQLESKFSSLLPIFAQDIAELKELIKPFYPSEFQSTFKIDDAIKWAVEEYLPYRYWMDRARLVDDKIIADGVKFSDYYYNNYESISYQYKNCLYRFIFNNKELIKETDVIVLLVLDNFSFRHFDYLKLSFSDFQFVPQNTAPYISLLPSETAISKFSLFSGLRDKIDSKSSGYDQTIKDTWQSYFPNHKISYLNRIGDLENYEVSEKEILVINYIEIDKELHKSFERTAKEHKDFIKFYISGITESVNKFCKKNSLENKTKILFVSDHGSTLINKKIPNEIDIKYFKNFKFDKSHRYLGLGDREYSSLKNNINVKDSLHFLDRQISGDGTNYIIARGYNRFIDISEEFYVHGGVSPEEVIVPTGYFEYKALARKSVIVQLKKSDYRLLVKEISKWRFANPNSELIENIYIECHTDDDILFQHTITELNPNSEIELSKEIRIKDENTISIKIIVSYKIFNSLIKDEFIFPISIKKMVQSKFDFDNF